MKVIKIVGMDNLNVKMFALELAWTISCKNSVSLQVDDCNFYEKFSFDTLSQTDFGNLNFMLNKTKSIDKSEDVEYVVTTLDVESDTVIYVVEQSLESVDYLNKHYDYQNIINAVFVYLNFIDSCYDSDYFKKFKFDKNINTRDILEFEVLFDEDSVVCQLENQLNGFVNLKKYPKRRKQSLYDISGAVSEGEKIKYRDFYKILDSRVPIC